VTQPFFGLIHEQLISVIRQLFPLLGNSTIAQSIAEKATYLTLPAGKILMETGDHIRLIPLVIKGSIKVVRADESGHEILLYYIQPGESCAITLSSCLRNRHSSIKAVTQQPTEIIGLPADYAYMLGRKHPEWLDFVLESYANRFDEVLHMVDEIGFASLDHRLAKYLREKSEALGTLVPHISHQEIADDLGTARAVVSRLLKQMERKGMVKLSRGRIRILSLMLPE
jgi:CRP/FNR family transcriptional regulator